MVETLQFGIYTTYSNYNVDTPVNVKAREEWENYGKNLASRFIYMVMIELTSHRFNTSE